jgi:serine/threonine protein kinase
VTKDSDVNIKVTGDVSFGFASPPLTSTTHLLLISSSDFGLAKSTNENGGLKTFCGTPQYFAPEVLSQENSASNATYSLPSDMWSVGVITFALLSGRLPWSDDDRQRNAEILKAKFSFRGEPWGDVSSEAKDFITKLMKKSPDDRLTAQQALHHPWFDSLSHLRDLYNPSSPPPAVASSSANVNGSKTKANGKSCLASLLCVLVDEFASVGKKKATAVVAGLPPTPSSQTVTTKRKGKRTIQETESPHSQLESIVEETAADVAEVIAPARKITRRQSAMEIATTIDNSKPSTRPRRAASRK